MLLAHHHILAVAPLIVVTPETHVRVVQTGWASRYFDDSNCRERLLFAGSSSWTRAKSGNGFTAFTFPPNSFSCSRAQIIVHPCLPDLERPRDLALTQDQIAMQPHRVSDFFHGDSFVAGPSLNRMPVSSANLSPTKFHPIPITLFIASNR